MKTKQKKEISKNVTDYIYNLFALHSFSFILLEDYKHFILLVSYKQLFYWCLYNKVT